MELREALTQITEIRLQLARTEVFRGYRAIPAAFSGFVALLAATIQASTISDPLQETGAYLALWIGAAVVSGLTAVTEMGFRARHSPLPLSRALTMVVLEQFSPCLVAGALVTLIIVRAAPPAIWMLPGLWQVIYSLGIFACSRLLPRMISGVAAFYMISGLSCLALAQGEHALSPWAMGVPFAVGQFLAALLLHRTLERDHDDA